MTEDEEIRLGREAAHLLEHPQMKKAFIGIETGLVESLKRVAMGDTKTQHELVLTLQLLEKLKKHFLEVMQTGKMAQIQKESVTKRVIRAVRG